MADPGEVARVYNSSSNLTSHSNQQELPSNSLASPGNDSEFWEADLEEVLDGSDPEAVLDVLAIRSQRMRYKEDDVIPSLLPVFPSHSDLELFVRDFAIDDAISDCFADSQLSSSAGGGVQVSSRDRKHSGGEIRPTKGRNSGKRNSPGATTVVRQTKEQHFNEGKSGEVTPKHQARKDNPVSKSAKGQIANKGKSRGPPSGAQQGKSRGLLASLLRRGNADHDTKNIAKQKQTELSFHGPEVDIVDDCQGERKVGAVQIQRLEKDVVTTFQKQRKDVVVEVQEEKNDGTSDFQDQWEDFVMDLQDQEHSEGVASNTNPVSPRSPSAHRSEGGSGAKLITALEGDTVNTQQKNFTTNMAHELDKNFAQKTGRKGHITDSNPGHLFVNSRTGGLVLNGLTDTGNERKRPLKSEVNSFLEYTGCDNSLTADDLAGNFDLHGDLQLAFGVRRSSDTTLSDLFEHGAISPSPKFPEEGAHSVMSGQNNKLQGHDFSQGEGQASSREQRELEGRDPCQPESQASSGQDRKRRDHSLYRVEDRTHKLKDECREDPDMDHLQAERKTATNRDIELIRIESTESEQAKEDGIRERIPSSFTCSGSMPPMLSRIPVRKTEKDVLRTARTGLKRRDRDTDQTRCDVTGDAKSSLEKDGPTGFCHNTAEKDAHKSDISERENGRQSTHHKHNTQRTTHNTQQAAQSKNTQQTTHNKNTKHITQQQVPDKRYGPVKHRWETTNLTHKTSDPKAADAVKTKLTRITNETVDQLSNNLELETGSHKSAGKTHKGQKDKQAEYPHQEQPIFPVDKDTNGKMHPRDRQVKIALKRQTVRSNDEHETDHELGLDVDQPMSSGVTEGQMNEATVSALACCQAVTNLQQGRQVVLDILSSADMELSELSSLPTSAESAVLRIKTKLHRATRQVEEQAQWLQLLHSSCHSGSKMTSADDVIQAYNVSEETLWTIPVREDEQACPVLSTKKTSVGRGNDTGSLKNDLKLSEEELSVVSPKVDAECDRLQKTTFPSSTHDRVRDNAEATSITPSNGAPNDNVRIISHDTDMRSEKETVLTSSHLAIGSSEGKDGLTSSKDDISTGCGGKSNELGFLPLAKDVTFRSTTPSGHVTSDDIFSSNTTPRSDQNIAAVSRHDHSYSKPSQDGREASLSSAVSAEADAENKRQVSCSPRLLQQKQQGGSDGDSDVTLTNKGADSFSEVTSLTTSSFDISTSADESSYYSGDDNADIDDDDDVEDDDDDDDDDNGDDEARAVMLGVLDEERADEELRHERLQRHLTSLLRQTSQCALTIETVVTATGERLCSQEKHQGEHVNQGVLYPFPKHHVTTPSDHVTTSSSEGATPEHQTQSTSQGRGAKRGPAHRWGATRRLFSPERQVSLVSARQMTSREFEESYDRKYDAAKIKRSQLDSDIPWDLLELSDTDDEAGACRAWYDVTSEEEHMAPHYSTDTDSSLTSDW